MPNDFTPIPTITEEEANTQPAPQQSGDQPLTIGDRAKDLVDSVNSGIGSAVHETFGFGAKVVGTLVQGGERITKPILSAVTGEDYPGHLSDDALLAVQEWNRGTAEADGSTYQSKTVAGGVSQGISQFLTGFALVGASIRAVGALEKVSALTRAAVTGAGADAVAFDPHAARLSDLVNEFAEKHPTLRNPVTEFMASNPDDSDAEGRLKNALEGMIAGAVLEKTLRAFGAAKRYLYNAPKDRAKAEKELAKALEEAEKAPSEPVQSLQSGGKSSEGAQGIPQKEIVDSPLTPGASTEVPKVTPEALDLTQTAVKDLEGKPLKVFHGTDAEGVKLNKDIPTYFTTNPTDSSFTRTNNVISAHVDIRKPLTPAEAKSRIREIEDAFNKFGVPEDNKKEILNGIKNRDPEAWFFVPPEARKAYESLGYDGLHINEGLKDEWYVPFSGKQVQQLETNKGPGSISNPPKVTPEGDLTLKPDETVTYGKDNPSQSGAPLLPQVDKDAIQAAIKDNPTWLEQGFVNLKGTLFNFSKWDGPDSAKLAVEEVAKVIPAPGKMTLKEIEAAAKDTGIDVTFAVNSGKVKAGEIAKTVVATKMLMQSQARQITDLARKMTALTPDDPAHAALKAEFDANIQKLTDTVNFGKTLQSDAARATTAGRIRTMDALSDDELKVIAAAGGDISTLTQVLKEKPLWVRIFDAHNQVWINSLLSGPRTHIRNILSNTINTIVLPAERAIGGAMSGNGAMFREGTDIALGLAGAFKDSIKMAAKAMGIPQTIAAKGNRWSTIKSTGSAQLDPGNTKLANTNSAAPALSTDNFKSLEGTKLGEVMNGFGQIANIPSRFLTGEDEFFKQINYRAHVTAAASASARKLGLKGKDMAEYIARRLEESMDDQGAAKLYNDDGIYTVKDPDYEAALEYARRATFTSKAEQGSFTAWLESGVHNHPYLKLITPFVRTPINILKNAGLRTPVLNLASKKYRDALTGKLGERAAADARGQMAVGAALWTSAITMAMEGSVTGKGPKDPKERAALIDTGWQPYSFKVGDKYLSFEGFDPFSMFFGLAGDYADMAAHLDDPTRDSVVAGMFIAAAQNITSKSYLLGLTQAMDALSDPGNKMEAFLRNRAGSYVPSALMQGAGLVGQSDPYMREARTTMDAVLRRIPGFSETLPPKRNVFGEAVTARQALGPDSISPFFTSTLTSNKAKLELARLGHAFGAPGRVLNGIDLSTVYNAKGQDFYDAWQAKLQTYRFGRYTLKEKLESLVTSPQYAKWRENEADALEAAEEPRTLSEVRAIISEYRERAKQELLRSGEFPQLSGALRAQKNAQVRARAGADIPEAVLNILNFNKQ